MGKCRIEKQLGQTSPLIGKVAAGEEELGGSILERNLASRKVQDLPLRRGGVCEAGQERNAVCGDAAVTAAVQELSIVCLQEGIQERCSHGHLT